MTSTTREMWAERLWTQNGLGALLLAYFHEDWRAVSGDAWQDVVADFARHEEAQRGAALEELDELLADEQSDADLEWLLSRGVSAAVDPDRFGYPTWRAWLQALRDELARLC